MRKYLNPIETAAELDLDIFELQQIITKNKLKVYIPDRSGIPRYRIPPQYFNALLEEQEEVFLVESESLKIMKKSDFERLRHTGVCFFKNPLEESILDEDLKKPKKIISFNTLRIARKEIETIGNHLASNTQNKIQEQQLKDIKKILDNNEYDEILKILHLKLDVSPTLPHIQIYDHLFPDEGKKDNSQKANYISYRLRKSQQYKEWKTKRDKSNSL